MQPHACGSGGEHSGGGGEHSSGGSRPSTCPQQNNTKGMRTPAPQAPLGSPPAADTRPGVLQQTRAVRGAGAALPRCLGPRSADLNKAPSNFSKSGRDGRRGAAAQHTRYGAVHMEAGQPRAMRSSSAPPGACSARSRAPPALSSRFSPLPDFRKGNSVSAKKNIDNNKQILVTIKRANDDCVRIRPFCVPAAGGHGIGAESSASQPPIQSEGRRRTRGRVLSELHK